MMKKILVLAAFLLLVAAACTMQPTSNNGATSNANTSAPKAPMVSDAEIIAKEKSGWDAVKKKDWDAFGKLLASDYIQVLDDGVYDKARTLSAIKDFDLSDATLSDWKTIPVNKDAMIVTYSSTVKATYKGQAAPAGPYREAAAYVNRNGEWVAIFYQETLAKTPVPSPSPKKSPAAMTSPGTMTKPAETGPDPAANEKLVWDALKSGNFDAFASYLAADSINIEPDGVYDKSGSVKDVSMMDSSKAELSDWKTLKLGDDASLVTYTVKLPGMGTEYHSTIWVRRDGKWLALFHQGTPAMPPPAAKPETKKM